MPLITKTTITQDGSGSSFGAGGIDLGGTEGIIQGIVQPALYQSFSPTVAANSLANNGIVLSSAIDNSTYRTREALIEVKIKTGAGALASLQLVYVGIVRSLDGGTTYEDSPGVIIGQLNVTATATTYRKTLSTRDYAGILPSFYKIALQNLTGTTLDSTAGNHGLVVVGAY